MTNGIPSELDVDAAFCISLDRREDRWQKFLAHNSKLGFGFVEKFSGVDGEQLVVPPTHEFFHGTIGCLHSHAALAEHCLNAGYESVLVLEDDCRFKVTCEELAGVLSSIRNHEFDWIHLGGLKRIPKRKEKGEFDGPHHVRSWKAINTHGQILSRRLMEAVVTYVRGNPFPTSIHVHSDRLFQYLCNSNGLPIAKTRKRLAIQDKKCGSDVPWSCPNRRGFRRSANHFYQDIPGWFDFNDIYASIACKAKPDDILVEVGVGLGRSASFMAVELQQYEDKPRLFCVDNFEETDFREKFPNAKSHREAFEAAMQPVRDQIEICPSDSIQAATQFSDHSISFAFLDSIHTYEHVSAEIDAWLPKIKQGGVLAGHDYDLKTVQRAVDEKLPSAQRVGKSWVFYQHDAIKN